ncbi:MAG: TetR/AcrR family transcriptional regulator; helix-turn-helix transcriptional regulator [Bacteroidetes bacterium]|nr:TetR/AcrR family transcriptional regulator; helix-turn-helix transcriptional regulator [Bacteroidota bacterium]
MASQKTDKAVIIKKAYQVFREKGYHNTSMADVGKACGLLKGSIYYYFPSKEELMKQVLISDHEGMKNIVCSLAYEKQLSVKDRLERIMQALESCYFDEPGGCLMANIGLESAHENPEFVQIIRHFFEDWIAAFSFIFQSEHEQEKAQKMAEQAVQEIEGAIMLSTIFQDKKYFISTSERICSYQAEMISKICFFL